MEFNVKLQELRKQKGVTQEQLASVLYVSRTAISKWESGRGYPSIDSLKDIAKYFNITIDELLSSNELIVLAETEQKQKQSNLGDLIFGFLDLSIIMYFFLPLFGQNTENIVKEVSLLLLNEIASYLKVVYFIFTILIIIIGILRLVFVKLEFKLWNKIKNILSLVLNILGFLLFMFSRQIYAAFILFIYILIKELLLLKLK